jgi:1-acyl-sn-glycerol-3-phosphate acyltransferase
MTRVRRPQAGFWMRVCMVLIVAFDRLLWRVRWDRLDRLPEADAGGVIVALNHLSYMDAVLMARLIWDRGRTPRFLAKAGLWRRPVVGRVLRATAQIPVYRGQTDAAESLRAAAAALDAGETVVIYPEGTTTLDPDQWPMLGKTGIARLWLLRPDTPVIPIGQWGAQRHTGAARWRWVPRRRVAAIVGPPVDLTRFRGVQADATVLREITDTIMTLVRDQVASLRGEPAPSEFRAAPPEAIRALGLP